MGCSIEKDKLFPSFRRVDPPTTPRRPSLHPQSKLHSIGGTIDVISTRHKLLVLISYSGSLQLLSVARSHAYFNPLPVRNRTDGQNTKRLAPAMPNPHPFLISFPETGRATGVPSTQDCFSRERGGPPNLLMTLCASNHHPPTPPPSPFISSSSSPPVPGSMERSTTIHADDKSETLHQTLAKVPRSLASNRNFKMDVVCERRPSSIYRTFVDRFIIDERKKK